MTLMITDTRAKELLQKIKNSYCRILGDNLVGIYIHGSMALGSFMWERSDIDFLAVVKETLSYEQKTILMKELVSFHTNANPRGLEMSIVQKQFCEHPIFPTPFDLHFSGGTLEWYRREPEQYCRNMTGEDADLGSYMAVIKQCGIVLYGEPTDSVFGDLPEDIYLKSVLSDIEDSKESYMEDFPYHTLNLCRTLAYLEDGIIRSKKSGGEWGLEHLPSEFSALIQSSLDNYCMGKESPCDKESTQRFCEYAFKRILPGSI